MDFEDTAMVTLLICALIGFAGWVTHIVWVIGKMTGGVPVTGGEMAMGVIGAFCPPIGAVHGLVIWFT